MEVIVPKTFELLGIKYTVKQESKVTMDGQSVFGWHDPKTATIKIRKNLKKDLKEQTFFHEAVHAALEAIGQSKLSCNENFVDSFSHAIYQIVKTAK